MSSSKLNSVSISVSDDEPDEPAGRVKVRGRRKRRKPFLRANRGFLDRTLRCWPLFFFVPAIMLLAFEASKLGRKQSEAVIVDRRNLEDSEDQRTNLNRLDPTTRVVNGVRKVPST